MFLRGLPQKNPAFLDAEDVVLCSRFLNVVCIVVAMWCDVLYHNFISLSFYFPKLVQPLFLYCVTAVLADILCNVSASLFILLFLIEKYNPRFAPGLQPSHKILISKRPHHFRCPIFMPVYDRRKRHSIKGIIFDHRIECHIAKHQPPALF